MSHIVIKIEHLVYFICCCYVVVFVVAGVAVVSCKWKTKQLVNFISLVLSYIHQCVTKMSRMTIWKVYIVLFTRGSLKNRKDKEHTDNNRQNRKTFR